ncbi:hypothetical protein HAZT_HAZT000815 [Hyalella azteca]|uniref:Rho-GAP domain-containing protein n=1 Tax=Hyalella azteca TaxID=294128 RepID=A0A6A0H1P6_HYAAZ|nr:hypothetical protein HAZT_HAZT000815 [Hyalella azteca]
MEFPVDVEGARRDHSFLSEGELNAFTKRIVTLNKCARVRFDHSTVKKDDDSDDEEQQCALSSNWHFERNSRRWSRVGAEPESRMLDVAAPPFKRSGSERIKDRAKELLRRVESMNTRRKKRPARDGKLRMRVGAPIISDPAAMESRVAGLACVDLPRQDAGDDVASSLRDAHVAPRHRSLSRHAHSQGEDSSSLTSDQSQNSTPLFRSRRRKKFLPSHDETSGHGNLSDVSGKSGGHDGSSRSGESGTAFSDSECSLPTNRSGDHRLTQDQNKLRAQLSAEGALESRQEHLPLQHSSSINVPFGLANPPPTKQQMLINNRNKSMSCSPLPPASSGDEERHSIYDNVPIIICNKSYHEYQPDVTMHSGLKSAREGSGSSEGFPADSRDSLSPADHELAFVVSAAQHLDVLQPKRRVISIIVSNLRNTVDRWHSFNSGSRRSTYSCDKGMPISHFSAGQLLILKKRALLRLTALMEHHCPSRPSWNWELPKFMLKRLRPSDAKTSPAVFGVSLHVTQRKTGYPLPPVIMEALSYLHKSCSDQVGLFRKPGVRSRIQKLRELIDQGETVDFTTYGAYDVADMVKTYFRELPEVLLTNKISELFLAIFHYLPEADRLEAVQCGLLMMPDENREALMTLLTFLAKIADNSSLNQMTASNLAVCLAPSLFHLCIGGVGASPLRRKNTSGTPEQKDLNDNKAAHVCLQAMIQQVSEIDFVRAETLSKISFTYLENSQPLHVEDLGLSSTYPSHHTTTEDGQETGDKTAVTQHSSDWAAYMDSCIAALVKEVKEKNRGYVSIMSPDPDVEVIYRKVGDGHPLRLWKVTTEVEAPPAELLTRVLRERHVWDDSLVRWRVIARLDHQSDVLQFITKSMPPKPHNDFCVLRYKCWRSDMGRVGGACALVETSVEHPDARLVDGCTRGVVLVSRYFIQPCGSGKSRVTHVSRIDLRSPEWYNKSYGALAARKIARLRDSFKHFAEGPESKV